MTLRSAGAVLVDPANIPTAKQMHDGEAELTCCSTSSRPT